MRIPSVPGTKRKGRQRGGERTGSDNLAVARDDAEHDFLICVGATISSAKVGPGETRERLVALGDEAFIWRAAFRIAR